MRLHLLHADGVDSGYGRFGTYMGDELRRLGVSVKRNILWDENIPDQDTVCATALWLSTPSSVRGWYPGQHPVVFTMWEAGTLPAAFRENMREFESIIVPSQQNLDLFSRFHEDVHKVPLGVDPVAWHPVARQDPEQEFVFLTGGQGSRKGIDVTIRAFQTVFGGFDSASDGRPTPKLVIKNRTIQGNIKGERVRQVSGSIPTEDEIALYASAHCYVGMARGEGFGLMPLQAMAQGCPTILTDAHGHAEFAQYGIPVSTHMEKADYFIYGDAGQWWEPDFDEVCEAMWDVYVNYDGHRGRAAHNAPIVGEQFSWARCAESVLGVLGDRVHEPDFVPTLPWHEPEVEKYLIISNKDCTYQINGISYRFLPGKRYFDRADLKRLMFENGNLDPVCIDLDETGLLPEQLERLDDYRADHSRCPTCHQRLNTNIVDEDEILAQLESV